MTRSLISAIGEAWPGLLPVMQRLVKRAAEHSSSRRCLNFLYLGLPARQKVRFHGYFGNVFVEDHQPLENGFWKIRFARESLRLPLTADGAWHEWNSALSILGSDPEVKITYANLLRWRHPRVFFDIGANYGLHSLLLLLHGVRTISFEPNVNCHGYLKRACMLNGLECQIQGVALSDVEGEADLWWNDRNTWNGTTDPRARERLARRFEIRSRRVEQTTVDSFVANYGCRPDLIKVDTEGSESRVLRGCRETLRTCRPLVIFESLPGSRGRREDLLSVFDELGYRISLLPFHPCSRAKLLDAGVFFESSATNFLAISSEDAAFAREG